MTEATRRAGRAARAADEGQRAVAQGVEDGTPAQGTDSADAERALARRIALVAPAVTLVAAAVVGEIEGIGPAILVLAGGALFATIAFFWASLRTLGGEAPLAEGFDRMTRRAVDGGDSAAERKRKALRALKDIEFEHSIGKIDDEDFAELSGRYREQAKAILREMDATADADPLREKAEQIARTYLAKRGLAKETKEVRDPKPPAREVEVAPNRKTCTECSASNEPDATFCKGCGAKLAKTTCSRCATVNERDALFCKRCGGALAPASTENVDASA